MFCTYSCDFSYFIQIVLRYITFVKLPINVELQRTVLQTYKSTRFEFNMYDVLCLILSSPSVLWNFLLFSYREIWELQKDAFIRRYQRLNPPVSSFDADIYRFVSYNLVILKLFILVTDHYQALLKHWLWELTVAAWHYTRNGEGGVDSDVTWLKCKLKKSGKSKLFTFCMASPVRSFYSPGIQKLPTTFRKRRQCSILILCCWTTRRWSLLSWAIATNGKTSLLLSCEKWAAKNCWNCITS